MNRGLLILGLGLAVALAAFALTHRSGFSPQGEAGFVRDGATRLPELAWLRRELSLDDAQYGRVRDLHLAHRPVCAALCKRIEDSRRDVAGQVAGGDTESPAFSAALRNLAAVETECRQAYYRHVHRTAAELSPGQARIYYRIVLPELSPGAGPAGHHP